jgi:type IV pilus assembly protein PilX
MFLPPASALPLITGRRQNGAALVVGLIFLVLLTMLGVAAFGISGMLERMSGHTRDRVMAFQAAELALRRCEASIATGAAPHFDPSDGISMERWNTWVQTTSASDANDNRVNDIWDSGGVTTAVNVDADGDGAQDFPVAPRCLIELMSETRSCGGNESLKAEAPSNQGRLYRITARGMTPSSATVVMLQTIHHACQ